MSRDELLRWIDASLARWPEAAERHRQAAQLAPRVLARYGGGMEWRALLLPARKVSTLARLDAASVAARPCFLCRDARPAAQSALPWRSYEILVNPFPIFPRHLTIAAVAHAPQRLPVRLADMAALADELAGFTIIYNGPRSGASAPDHFHFQAVPSGCIDMAGYDGGPVYCRTFASADAAEVADAAERWIDAAGIDDNGEEMPLNAAMERMADGRMLARIVPRRRHRPSCYPAPAISPGAVDIFGTLVAVNAADFNALNQRLLEDILAEVAYPNPAGSVRVGIMTSPTLAFTLHGDYERVGDTYFPRSAGAAFSLADVPVGAEFHWQHTATRTYPGILELHRAPDGTATAVNVVGMEQYLQGVIGAEMSPDSPDELLKAHAVISRSWAWKQVAARRQGKKAEKAKKAKEEDSDYSNYSNYSNYNSCRGREVVRWYDHEDHEGFDVCADDHCQRYLGVPAGERAERLRALVEATAGEVVLDPEGRLCDTRFSKCCGGAFELFESCWEPASHPYLAPGRDLLGEAPLPDLRSEAAARRWILSAPPAFCASPAAAVLRAVLNRSDLATTPDFYRWTVSYTPEELSAIVADRSGLDLGLITDLQPVERGPSGRIVRLRIVGQRMAVVVGKELEIRRWLSRSHLYSSAFVVDRGPAGEFVLHGAGWGHGVGLCQIGAAVMAAEGHDYRTILHHYFANVKIGRCDG